MFRKTEKKPSDRSILLTLLISWLVMSVLALMVHNGLKENGIWGEPWLVLISLPQFQPTMLPMYVVCFYTGIFAFARNWFKTGKAPGHYFLWSVLVIVLLIVIPILGASLRMSFSPCVAISWVMLRMLVMFFFLLTFISFSIRRWNRPSRVNNALSATSYDIYIVHMVFLLTLQLFAKQYLSWTPIFLKFSLVSLGAIGLSYLTSRFILKPFPLMSVLGSLALAGILFFVL